MKKPLFSVIIPIFNIESFLGQCVQSGIGQSYDNIEIILVDDGSTDSCSLICDDFAKADDRIHVVHKTNGGIVSARQVGVTVASGEYVIFVDGDDWADESYLEKVYKVINNNHPDIVCCGHYLATENGNIEKPLPYRFGYYSKSDIENEVFPMLIQKEDSTYFPPSLWAKAFKKEVYQQQQLVDVIVNIGEDGACTIPCIFHATSLYIMPDCLYYYRYNMASMTKGHKAFRWNGPEIIKQHIERQIDIGQFGFKEQLYRKTVHELFSVIVSQFYKKETYRSIVRDIKIHLENPVYNEAIYNCKFSGSIKAVIMYLALKHRWMVLIWMYSKVK